MEQDSQTAVQSFSTGRGSRNRIAPELTIRDGQGLDNQLIVPVTAERKAHGTVQRKQRLGGSLNYYYGDAA
jgi:hypothetical protein